MSLKPALVAFACGLAVVGGCEEKKPSAPASGTGAAAPKADDHGHGGAVVQLGTATVGPFDVKATRDEGAIGAGREAAIDVTVTSAVGGTAKAAAVRFWVGTEDAKGSVKARAEIEDPKEPNRWHTHAEVPDPMPAGSRLWVEIEDDQGGKHTASFELKA
ncbi:MAG: hypothetical protein WD749_14315 [Phycisphaerales bacterium]